MSSMTGSTVKDFPNTYMTQYNFDRYKRGPSEVSVTNAQGAAAIVLQSDIDSLYSGSLWGDAIVPGNTLQGPGLDDFASQKALSRRLKERVEANLEQKYGELSHKDERVGSLAAMSMSVYGEPVYQAMNFIQAENLIS